MQTSLDLDAERVRRAAAEMANGTNPDKQAMDAAVRLKERAPNHPALTWLERELNSRDGF